MQLCPLARGQHLAGADAVCQEEEQGAGGRACGWRQAETGWDGGLATRVGLG